MAVSSNTSTCEASSKWNGKWRGQEQQLWECSFPKQFLVMCLPEGTRWSLPERHIFIKLAPGLMAGAPGCASFCKSGARDIAWRRDKHNLAFAFSCTSVHVFLIWGFHIWCPQNFWILWPPLSSPLCHCYKSADFVLFVCFLDTPSPTHCGRRRHVCKPPFQCNPFLLRSSLQTWHLLAVLSSCHMKISITMVLVSNHQA